MSGSRKILIIGAGVSAWLPAAILAARLPATAYQITVCDTGDTRTDTLLARPYICRAHDLIGIDDAALARHAAARPVHAYKVSTKTRGSVVLPFGDFGLPFLGAGFTHYWLRAHLTGQARPLSHYNLALRLDEAGGFLNKAPKGLPFLDYGYDFPRQAYCALLKQIASRAGVRTLSGPVDGAEFNPSGLIENITLAGTQISPDLTVCAGHPVLPDPDLISRLAQSPNGLHIQATSDMPGAALHQLQTGTMRLMSLWPGNTFTKWEKAELDRLYHAETSHIEDMTNLLENGPNMTAERPALQRKRQVFAARGRVPAEDYEVFSKPEWLAAMFASGLVPRHYDRLADRVSLEQATAMLTQIENRIDQLLSQNATTRRAI